MEKQDDRKPVDEVEIALPGSNGVANYRRIANLLRQRINRGEWLKGERMPNLPELMEEFGAGRITVRSALDLLEQDHYIKRYNDRRGTIVVFEPLDRRFFTLALDLQELGNHSGDVISELVIDTPAPVPSLRRAEGRLAPSYRRLKHRHRPADLPYWSTVTDILLDTSVYEEVGPPLFASRPVLDLVAQKMPERTVSISQTLTIAEAEIEVATLMGVPISTPIAELRRVVLSRDRLVTYIGHLEFRGDMVRLEFST